MANALMFIFGDGRHGHELVKSMCSYMEKKDNCAKCLVAVCDKSFEKEMEDVKRKRCEIEALDLRMIKQHPEELEKVMRKHKVDWLVLQPSGESFHTPDCVRTALECFKKVGGKNVIMPSIAKCDECEELPLKECHQAEMMVKQHFPRTHTILRVQMPLIDLDFFADGVKQERKWMLPTGNSNFSPVSTKRDMACCIGHVVHEHQKSGERFAGQTFTLTNREKLNGQRLAEMTGSAFNEDVSFQNISIEEAGKILERYVGRGGGFEEQQSAAVAPQQGKQPQKRLRRGLLNRPERDMVLVVFKMIQNGKYDFVTEDVKKISGMDPMSVEQYLRKRENFLRG